MKKYMYIANWKMFFSHQQSCVWLDEHADALTPFYPQLVLCPSYESLAHAATHALNNFILGAQDCSEYALGAHTGQISAQSLAEFGCQYCIIGHSELLANLTNEKITQKLIQLQQHTITPVLCVRSAETQELEPAINFPKNKLLIAYEPLESIGTGHVAPSEHIAHVIDTIKKYFNDSCTVLYGGSVGPENIEALKKIEGVDGFLIGSASINFNKLVAIMKSE